MQITKFEPANIPGTAGDMIRNLNGYWRDQNGIFRSGMPHSNSLLLYVNWADGENLPKMGYLGKKSFLNEIMEGQFGEDYSASVQNQDPRFYQTAAAGFVEASKGHMVADRIEMEVTPPGHLKPYPVDYFRIIRRFQIGVTGLRTPNYILSVLVVPTDEWRIWHGREYLNESWSRTRNSLRVHQVS